MNPGEIVGWAFFRFSKKLVSNGSIGNLGVIIKDSGRSTIGQRASDLPRNKKRATGELKTQPIQGTTVEKRLMFRVAPAPSLLERKINDNT